MRYLILNVFLMLLGVSCLNDSEKKRNMIVFEDSIDSVRDTILRMNYLMGKIPFPEDINKNYILEKGIFEVNGDNLGAINEVELDTINLFTEFTEMEKKEFVSKVSFLKRNHLSSVYWSCITKHYFYHYRTTRYDSFSMTRILVLKKDSLCIDDYNELFTTRKILDHRNGLILIGSEK